MEVENQELLIENARKIVSGFLNTSPGNIFFTSGGTEADNMAIRCGILIIKSHML